MKSKKQLSLFGLIGVTIAFFASVRPTPQIAVTGWTSIFYLVVAALFFALPIALISAELSTTYTQKGGSQVWINRGISPKWSFVSSWLIWLMMLVGLVMILSTLGELLGYVINQPSLGENSFVTFAIIVGVFWLMTWLCLKTDMLRLSSIGAVIGVYVPFAVLTVLSIAYLCKHGINANSYLADFSFDKLLPDFSDPGSLPTLTAIVFIFAGVEMSAVHIGEVKNPSKTYPIGVISAVLAVVVLSIVTGLGYADAVPKGGMMLANVMQGIALLVTDAGLPSFVNNLLALCIIIGILTKIGAWLLGPCQSLLQVGRAGMLPKWCQQTDSQGNPVNIIFAQAVAATAIALLFLVITNVDEVFNILTISATLFYCIVYVLIGISAIRLRLKDRDLPHPFRLGKKGNATMFICAGLAIFSSTVTILVSLIPPNGLESSLHTVYIIGQLAFTGLMIGIALLIYHLRRPAWKKQDSSHPNISLDA
ncbi:MAG: APC family permease [Clostridia bacterium]